MDGLACSFLLSNPDLLVYDSFYDSLVTLLAAGAQRDKLMGSTWTALDAACVRYHFNICWRLLGCLPPSAGFLRQLELGQPPRLSDGPLLLHTLRWAPRLPHKAFQVSMAYYHVLELFVDLLLVVLIPMHHKSRLSQTYRHVLIVLLIPYYLGFVCYFLGVRYLPQEFSS